MSGFQYNLSGTKTARIIKKKEKYFLENISLFLKLLQKKVILQPCP